MVYLTEKGKEIREIILEKLIAFLDALLSDFTPEEKNFQETNQESCI